MGWDPGSRAKVNGLAQQGLIAVRYTAKGCNVELEVLSHCIGSSTKYSYTPYWSMETKTAKNAGELYAELPLGAAGLKGKLNGSRILRTDYRLVGQLSIPADAVVDASSLKGPECARATHVVSSLYVGGFALVDGESEHLSAVADVFLAEAGGQKDSRRQRLFLEGDPEACERGKASGKLEPLCGVPLRVALLPLVVAPAAAAPSAPTSAASKNSRPSTGEMVRVPAGSYWMGSNEADNDEKPVNPVTGLPTDIALPSLWDNEKPVHRVTVDSFEMDRTEVTVAAYQACVNAGTCKPAGSGEFCNAGKADKSNHPINCVDWNQATAFCNWAGKRLPTEEEWEYAARGTDGRKYPWGSSAPSDQLCWSSEKGTCTVGSFPSGASPFGIQDMAGNVGEWTSSGYSWNYQKTRTTDRLVVRGSRWAENRAELVRAACRFIGYKPSRSDCDLGFRCAR